MRTADYTDDTGRTWRVELPDGAPDSEAEAGVPVGPPDLSGLGLPEPLAVRLHNELWARRILTRKDAVGRVNDIRAALQKVLAVDALEIQKVYLGED